MAASGNDTSAVEIRGLKQTVVDLQTRLDEARAEARRYAKRLEQSVSEGADRANMVEALTTEIAALRAHLAAEQHEHLKTRIALFQARGAADDE